MKRELLWLPFLAQQFLAGRRVEEGEVYLGDRFAAVKPGDGTDLAVGDLRAVAIDDH